jgi:aminoglycoside 6'-N-acetyltransferase I
MPKAPVTNHIIRALRQHDLTAWQRFRVALWPALTAGENETESAAILADTAGWSVFVSEVDGRLSGFVEVSLRRYADGCASSPVGYVEGWYVDGPFRRSGVGRQLLAAAEDWARAQGCTEMASDALLDNVDSYRAHCRLGYAEVERQVIFRKSLV